MRNWFRWKAGEFEHSLNLGAVVQWLYHPAPDEHAFVWIIGQHVGDRLSLNGELARKFRDAMVEYMGPSVYAGKEEGQ